MKEVKKIKQKIKARYRARIIYAIQEKIDSIQALNTVRELSNEIRRKKKSEQALKETEPTPTLQEASK